MGRKSREKRDRRLAKAVLNEFGPKMESVGFQRGLRIGRLTGLGEAAGLKSIKEVKALHAAALQEEEKDPTDGGVE